MDGRIRERIDPRLPRRGSRPLCVGAPYRRSPASCRGLRVSVRLHPSLSRLSGPNCAVARRRCNEECTMSLLRVYRDDSQPDVFDEYSTFESIRDAAAEAKIRFERWDASRVLAPGATQEDVLS